jgi:two-component system LytT family response regulator
MKVVIIDDEFKSREVLKNLLTDYKDVQIIGEAETVSQGIEVVTEKKPEVVFLDISLVDKLGFDLLDGIENVDFEVVFVTSYSNYAIKAIKYDAFDYLLKPIDLGELDLCIQKLRDRVRAKTEPSEHQDSIMVHVGMQVRILHINDIFYVEADGAYSILHTEKESFQVSKNIKTIETQYGDTQHWIRISRNLLVNRNHILSYSKGNDCFVVLTNQVHLEVSRRRKSLLIKGLV